VREQIGARAADAADPQCPAAFEVMHDERLDPRDEFPEVLPRDAAFLQGDLGGVEIDLLVVSKAGTGPRAGGLLYGSPRRPLTGRGGP